MEKLTGKQAAEPKKFLALVITDEVVQAAVWRVTDEQTEIVSLGSPVEWDGEVGTSSELVTAVDGTIASATEGVEGEINEIILGIPYSWIDKTGIVESKRTLIKKINQELELKTLGYVTLTDSVLTYLKMQEGSPTSAILVAIGKHELTVVLVRLGRIEAVRVGKSEGKIEQELVSTLKEIGTNDNLPSRIILFDNMHSLDEIAQNLMQVPWQKEFEFLHLPKVEALPKDVAIRSLALAGGSEVARSLGFAIEENQEIESEIQEPEVTTMIVGEEEIGFGINKSPEEPEIEAEEINNIDEVEEELEVKQTPRIKWKMPHVTLPHWQLPRITWGKWWWAIVGVLAVAGVIGVTWWMVPQAEVMISVPVKWIDQEVPITLDTGNGAAAGQNIVRASTQTVRVSGEKMSDTTGKKIIGDKASGEVTIYNRTTLNKIMAKGTTLTGPGGVKFSLDAEVSIASKSAGVDYVDVPGKATVKVIANAIGAESNMAAGTEFTIGSFGKDSYVAKNESAIGGGTSEEVQVVAKDDQKLIASELTRELSEQLEAQIQSGAGEAQYLIPSSIKIESEKYSAKIGEEAKSVGLELTLTGTLLVYKVDEVRELIGANLNSAVPSGYSLADLPTQVELTASQDAKDEQVAGVAKVRVALLPTYNLPELTKLMQGKSLAEAEAVIRQVIRDVSMVNVRVLPKWWPYKLRGIPHNSTRIKIAVEADSS